MSLHYSLHSFYDFTDFIMLFLSGEISPIKSPICVCTSTFYRRATRFSIARLKLYYRPLDDGNDTRFAQGVMTCDGILHSQKLWVYLSAAAVHSSRGLCKICSENKWTRVESLALSHSSRVTQFESLMLSYLSPRVY